MTGIKDRHYKLTEKLLYNYNMLKASIKNMKQEINELENDVVGPSSISYETEKTGKTYKTNRPTEETAIKNITYIDLLEKRIEMTQSKIERIDRSIEALNEVEKQVVRLRYIDSIQWFQIAYKLKYTERWCKHLRTQAIKKIAVGIYGETAISE